MDTELVIIKGYANQLSIVVLCGLNQQSVFVMSPKALRELQTGADLVPIGFPRSSAYAWDGVTPIRDVRIKDLQKWIPSEVTKSRWQLAGNKSSPMNHEELARLQTIEFHLLKPF